MRSLIPALLLLPATAHENHESNNDLLYGIEVLTGYRSEYVDRGFKLANDLIEVQIGTEIALSNDWWIDFGAWYGTETGSGSFDQASAFFGVHYDHDRWRTGLDLTYSSYSDLIFRDGIRIGPYFDWFFGADWRVGAAVEYDDGAKGWYGKLEAEWSQPTGDNSFVTVLGGLSATSDFYRESGWNDAFGRLSWTYQINRHVAVTPFAGTSIGLDSGRSDRFFGGLWFEVNF